MANLYDKYVLPHLIDFACSQRPFMALRNRYVSQAKGRVLEVGLGSGLNLSFYGPGVVSVTGRRPRCRTNGESRKTRPGDHRTRGCSRPVRRKSAKRG